MRLVRQLEDTSSCLLHIGHERSRCQPPSDRDKCRPAWFSIQLHVLSVHQRLINIAGSPVIPRCSFCLYTAPVTLYGVHSRTLPTRCCCFNQAQSKLDSMWGLCVCIHAKVISAKIAASCMFPQKAQMQLTHDFYQHTLSHICAHCGDEKSLKTVSCAV